MRPARGLAFAAAVTLATLGVGEAGARLLGYRPWQVHDPGVRVVPGGRLFQSHPRLGYAHLPGRYTVWLPTGYAFRVTHRADGLRATRPLEEPASDPRPIVAILGCSITHGWSVNDEESYPWLVQQRLGGHDVVNFGVSGYGEVQSLIQLQDLVAARPAPLAAAVLAYASFHDQRNTLSRSRSKAVVPWNRLGPLAQPFARLDPSGALQVRMATATYREFPLMRRLALAHALEQAYDELEASRLASQDVTHALILEMSRVARGAGMGFGVVGLTPDAATRGMLDRLRADGIAVADISFEVTPRDVNLPHDTHPSPLAHAKYARGMLRFLGEALGIRG